MAVRAHARRAGSTDAVLAAVGRDVWEGSTGDLACAALYAVIGRISGEIRLTLAGDLTAGVWDGTSFRLIPPDAPPLGTGHEEWPAERRIGLALDESIVVWAGECNSRGGSSRRLSSEEMQAVLRASCRSRDSAAESARRLSEQLAALLNRSQSIFIIRRAG
jgi:hypothetical protein